MQPHEITSVQNPRVKAAAKLRDHRGRRKAGRILVEGRRAVERAGHAGLVFRELWVCPELLSKDDGAAQAELRALADAHADAWRAVVSPAVFRKLAYVREPEGVLAVCEPPAWGAASLRPTPADTMDLVAVGTEKPGNLGAMVRTADAAGCRAVLAAGAAVDAFNPNAIRASTGTVFTMPTVSLTEDETLEHLKRSGQRVLAAYPEASDAVPLTRADFTGPIAVVVGPEDRGLSETWRGLAHATDGCVVRIPMAGGTADSLNASVAAAVLLYEAVRQRSKAET
jgi:TrmH family RNA methyltransferase